MSTLAKIAELKGDVADLTTSLKGKVRQIRATRRSLWFARHRKWYYAFAKSIRKPAEQYSLWFPGVLLVGSATAAAIVFVLLYAFGSPALVLALGTILAGVIACGCLAATMITPATETLPAQISQEEAFAVDLRNQITHLKSKETKLRQQLAGLRGAIRDLQHSDQLQRELLLQQNWQEMRGTQWEAFLVEAFRLLGAQVDVTPPTGDQGVDLLVCFGGLKIAVQAKGYSYDNPVGNTAVQEVVAGKVHYGCDRAAVISNSRFTKSAIELANSNSCHLIGRKEFESFVMGSNLELLKRRES